MDYKEYDKSYYQKNKEKIKERTKVNCGGKGIQKLRHIAKEECRRRANYICQICGREGLDAHHLIPVEKGGTDEQDNLICLCRSCHQKIHHNTLILENGRWVSILAASAYRPKEHFRLKVFLRQKLKFLKKYYHDTGYLEIWHEICYYYKNFNTEDLEKIKDLVEKYDILMEVDYDNSKDK